MRRDIRKAVSNYERRGKSVFTVSDFDQIVSIAEQTNRPADMVWKMVDTALKAGYEVGYRTAKREASHK